MKGKELAMTMEMSTPAVIDEASGVSIPGFTYTVTMDGTYSASSTQPQTQPPAGADVVDLMEQLTVEMDPVSV